MRSWVLAGYQAAIACLLLLLWVAVPALARSADPIVVEVETQATSSFPEGIAFEAEIPVESGTDITDASLYYRVASDPTLNEASVAPDALVEGDDHVSVARFIDLQTAYIPPGVSLEFFWELTITGGDTVVTTPESVLWIDSRFDWDVSNSEQITLYTYGMTADFVAWMLEQSQATLDDLESRYGLDPVGTIAIWIYPDSGDFSGARQPNMRESVAAIAYPGSSLVVAIVPDGNEREFWRVIPHEISHQVLFHATDNPFAPPPIWLDEGLATHYQTGGTDHYAAMVWRAASSGTLFDITSLNVSFPYQPFQATLAYAASWSIVDYIEATWGPDGIARLIAAFGEGLPVDEAIEAALDVSPSQLNTDWHAWVLEQGDPDG